MRLCESKKFRAHGGRLRVSIVMTASILAVGTLPAFSLPTLSSSVCGATARTDSSGSWRASLAEGQRLLKTKQLAKAELCFRAAYKEAKRNKMTAPDDLVLCMQSLAGVLYMQDLIVETIPLYKKSLRVLEKAHGKKSPQVVPTMVILGGIFEDEGDYKKSVKYYSPAIEIVADTSGANSLTYADCLHRLGRVQEKEGLLKKAEENYFASLTITMKQPVLPSSDLVEEIVADYTSMLLKTEDNGKALNSAFQNELLKDRIGLLKKKRGAPDSNFSRDVTARMADQANAEALKNASPPLRGLEPGTTSGADVNASAGVNANANSDEVSIRPTKQFSDFAALEEINRQRVAFYERMIAADIDTLGPDHPSVARDLNGLASIYLSERKYEAAKPLLQRTLVIYQKVYREDSDPVKQARLLLQLISEEQNPTAAVDITAIDSLPKIPLEAQKIEVALRLNDLAFMLYCQGKIQTALRVYSWALASTIQSSGETSLLTASSMIDMSRLLRLTGRATEAEQMEVNARAIARRDILEKRSKILP